MSVQLLLLPSSSPACCARAYCSGDAARSRGREDDNYYCWHYSDQDVAYGLDVVDVAVADDNGVAVVVGGGDVAYLW